VVGGNNVVVVVIGVSNSDSSNSIGTLLSTLRRASSSGSVGFIPGATVQ